MKTLKGSADRPKQAMSVGNIPMKKNDNTYESTLADMDSPVLAAIVGLCPDMCPGAYCSRLTFFSCDTIFSPSNSLQYTCL